MLRSEDLYIQTLFNFEGRHEVPFGKHDIHTKRNSEMASRIYSKPYSNSA
jgi:hypothetical protein